MIAENTVNGTWLLSVTHLSYDHVLTPIMPKLGKSSKHTHTHTHTHIYIYIYMCVCVCVCV